MKKMKHSTKKDRTNDSFNIWIRHDSVIHVCSDHPGKMKHSTFHTSYHDNIFTSTDTLFNFVWLGKLNNDFRSPNSENELSGTLNTNIHT